MSVNVAALKTATPVSVTSASTAQVMPSSKLKPVICSVSSALTSRPSSAGIVLLEATARPAAEIAS